MKTIYKQKQPTVQALLDQLQAGGGSSFTPTEQQLAAMNSGIDSTKVGQIATNAGNITAEQAKTSCMGTAGTDYIVVNSIRVYVSATEPTGDIPEGSIWINTAVINP